MRGPWLMAVLVGAWIGAAVGPPTEVAARWPAPRASLDQAPPASVALRAAAPGGPARRALARPSARNSAAIAGLARAAAPGRAGATPVPVSAVVAAPPLVAVRAGSGAEGEPAHAAERTLAGGGSAPRAPPRAPI